MEMIIPKRNIGRIIFLVIATIIMWFGTFGILYHVNEMGVGGHTNGCLFDGSADVCAMNYSEHITSWQSMFTSLPQNLSLINLLVLTILSVTLLFSRRNILKLTRNIASRWRLYIKLYSPTKIYNPLKEAFSQGILNPKIYNGAI